jgi:hypothetical protein
MYYADTGRPYSARTRLDCLTPLVTDVTNRRTETALNLFVVLTDVTDGESSPSVIHEKKWNA